MKKRIVLVKRIKQKEDKQLMLLDGKSDRVDYTGRYADYGACKVRKMS